MKKLGSLLTATLLALSVLSAAAFAAPPNVTPGLMFDEDGALVGDLGGATNIVLDGILPGETFYIALGEAGELWTTDDATDVESEYMTDTDYFRYKLSKDTNSTMVSSITVVTEKKFDGYNRANYLKVTLKDSTTTEEIKSTGTITFTAKKNASDITGASVVNTFASGDVTTLKYTFWINNEKVTNDGNPDTGDRVYFNPEKNENNTFIWGEDRAALQFTADDSADDFYARLSTSSISSIWTEYADPVGADVWFYNFVNNPTVPSTSRANLTLGVPWDDDDDYVPDPEDCFIYQMDSDGSLIDVTANFTYSEDDYEIPGWTIRTRTLGTYIVSDVELEIEETLEEIENEPDTENIPETGGADDATNLDEGKVVANTGRKQ